MIDLSSMIELLDEGGYSCVIANGEHVRHYSQRGVADLYRLSKENPELLDGATIVDKVVGKGAAALMAISGVRRVYTHLISEGGYKLLIDNNIMVEFGQKVPHIINRQGDGWCPVELRTRESNNLDKIIKIIEKFIIEQK